MSTIQSMSINKNSLSVNELGPTDHSFKDKSILDWNVLRNNN